MLGQSSLLASILAQAAGGLRPQDVFATNLYTGNGSTRTITNGINLSGEGGLVWFKQRTSTEWHSLYDTLRGPLKRVATNSTAAELYWPATLTSFLSDGFSLGSDPIVNGSGNDYAAWTFRRAPKFFDVVTWTGNGGGTRAISHALASSPGFIVFKRTDATDNWYTWNRATETRGALNSTGNFDPPAPVFGDGTNYIAPTSTAFTVEGSIGNVSGGTYVAYLFAHDTDPSGVVQCGSFSTGSGSGTVSGLGWRPQFLMIKAASSSENWYIYDTSRGWGAGNDAWLMPNSSAAEFTLAGGSPTSDGFTFENATAGQTYIYLAIREPI